MKRWVVWGEMGMGSSSLPGTLNIESDLLGDESSEKEVLG